jgi:hypothetical protein
VPPRLLWQFGLPRSGNVPLTSVFLTLGHRRMPGPTHQCPGKTRPPLLYCLSSLVWPSSSGAILLLQTFLPLSYFQANISQFSGTLLIKARELDAKRDCHDDKLKYQPHGPSDRPILHQPLLAKASLPGASPMIRRVRVDGRGEHNNNVLCSTI